MKLFHTFLDGRNVSLTKYNMSLTWGPVENPSGIADRSREHIPRFTMENISSQTEVISLPKQFLEPRRAQWDGQYLFADYCYGGMLILDHVHTTICSDP